MSEADDVLRSIDQLRRDLSGYHEQLKAHNDLQRHCDRQREQLAALGAAHKPIKDERDAYKRQADRLVAENAKLRDTAHKMWCLLVATGNDDLVISIEANGIVKEIIDAEELAKTMRELGIEV